MMVTVGYMLVGMGIFLFGLIVGGALVMAGYNNGSEHKS